MVDALEVSLRGEFKELHGDLKELRENVKETEIRLATELVAVTGAVREVRDLFREDGHATLVGA